MPRITIVIPVFNQAEMTEKCLFAIAENTGEDPDYGVVVVDNGSTDWTMYLLHAMEGDIQVLNNDQNEGFARACNKGGAAGGGGGEYLLFLNNDTVPRPGWLRALVELADSSSDIGVVGAKLVYLDSGKIQHAGIAMVEGVPDHVNRGVDEDDPRVIEVQDYDMVTGACLLIRKTLFEQLGGFDADFINGVEDVDLCLRARDLGLRVVYCPDSVVEHHEAASEGRFDNVATNLGLFHERWGDRFDAQGRFIPRSEEVAGREFVPAEQSVVTEQLTVNWEGSFMLHSSLAYVNREMALALLASERCDLGLQSFEPDEFGVEEDARFWPLAQRMDRPYPKADFHVKHRWPPDFSRPNDGSRFILMQPWEFGRLPASWMEPLLGSVDEVWAYTSSVKQCYVDSGIDPDMVSIVPLGVDPGHFRPDAEPFAYDTDKAFKFLFVGGTLYRKGIDLLLLAYYEAFDPAEDVCLVIKDMGANSFYRNQNARERIEQLQGDPDCADIVYRSDNLRGIEIPGLYTAADALVHPYRGEGFGLPVAEAMACGLPVIVTAGGATDDFCPPELVYGIPAQRKSIHFEEQTAGEAWLLEPDIEVLKQNMRTVFENAAEAAARGARASEHIHSRFTWEQSGARALEVLSDRAAGHRAHPRSHERRAPTSKAPQTGVRGGKQLFADFGGRDGGASGEADSEADQETLQAASSPLTVDGGVEPTISDRNGTATVFLKIGQEGGSDHSRLTHLPDPVDAFEVTVGSQYPLGSQLELIRNSSQNREFIAIIGPQTPTAEEMGQLATRLSSNPKMAMVSLASQIIAGHDLPYPDISRGILVRAEALVSTGGFDESFAGPAVIGNVTRCMRTQGWDIDLGQPLPAAMPESDGEWFAVGYLEEGDRLRREGKRKESLLAYRQAVEANPNLVEALLVLTDCLVDEGELAAAIDAIEHLVSLDKDSSWAHNYAGLVHFKAGNAESARAHFRRALDLQPELVEARVNLAVLEWESEDFESALRELGEASRVDPTNRDLVCNISLIYTQIGQWEAAVTVLEDYLTLRPEDVEILHQLADVLAKHGSATNARQTAERILQIDPANARAAQIIEQCGGWEEEEEQKKHPPLA